VGLGDRLARLEERRAPPAWETPPLLTLLLKEMDAEARERDGRPPDPDNAVITPEEMEAAREATRNFLPYLLGERARSHPTHWPHLDHWIAETKAEIATLDIEEAQARQDIEQSKGASE
jgi:hypothetical protein